MSLPQRVPLRYCGEERQFCLFSVVSRDGFLLSDEHFFWESMTRKRNGTHL